MEIFENKKIGLIVTIVLSVGGMIALMACFAPQSGPSNYITGAVMGVPSHDERDFDFANKYGKEAPIMCVVEAEPGGGSFA